jgi:hypothetical protein
MTKKIFLCVIIFGMGSLSAQSFSGKLNPFPPSSPLKVSFEDTIRILAVMADFQIDNDASTVGNGKFGTIYSRDYGSEIIDPLPHDKTYFENHLIFVQNYFYKVSGQKLNIAFTVLPEIVTVSKTMRNYSPPPRSEDLTPVAEFAREVWMKADSAFQGFPFSDYDVFFIFHAGVGRDISLPGSLGNERDLPSLYFGPEAFERIFPGEGSFPVSGGSFHITNSAVIPETESRELSAFGSTVLFELSINGLMAATLASHLGLPDLFDTRTGLSAIGRFGLMDGQSIFAYNGLFPPEPSAWEKIYLGWEIPAEASINKEDYSLIPSILAGIGDTAILKVNLSSSEYYLIQNRQRDANADGATVTFISKGEVVSRTFPRDTTGFLSYSVDLLEGVIIDVDEFDWALPGSGIVIWHIDEEIIRQNIASNTINNDIRRRGVDVEEADGIQDIGVQFQTIFGDVIIGEGEQRDFWFKSNDAELYENRFSYDTRPNTLTNTGANSLITISDFSDISNRMNFKVVFGDTIVKPVAAVNLPVLSEEVTLSSLNANLGLYSFVSDNKLFISDVNGNIIIEEPGFTTTKPASYVSGDTTYIAGTYTDLNLLVLVGTTPVIKKQIPAGAQITSNAVIMPERKVIIAGARNGRLYIYNFDTLLDSVLFEGINDITYVSAHYTSYFIIARKGEGYVYDISTDIIIIDKDKRVRKSSDIKEIPLDFIPTGILLTYNLSGSPVAVINSDKRILIISDRIITINKENSGNGIALADLKRDGNNYIIFNDGSKIKAVSLNGTPADNFPFTDPLNVAFDNYLLTADFEGDNSSEVIAFTNDGRIFAIDGFDGRVIRAFPLSAGRKLKAHPVLFNNSTATNLSVIDQDNNFYTWSISSIPGRLFWSELYGNSANTAFVDQAGKSNVITNFFPKERVYNYPNPVYEGKTYIRYYVAENSEINVRIFDLAGALVEELNSSASAGFDGEIEWNVNSVQSGVYLARVEASSAGNKEVNFIKIAVVK